MQKIALFKKIHSMNILLLLLILGKLSRLSASWLIWVMYLISCKIYELSNSFLFVVDKERMRELVKFFIILSQVSSVSSERHREEKLPF